MFCVAKTSHQWIYVKCCDNIYIEQVQWLKYTSWKDSDGDQFSQNM
jgi:hypothetical protein